MNSSRSSPRVQSRARMPLPTISRAPGRLVDARPAPRRPASGARGRARRRSDSATTALPASSIVDPAVAALADQGDQRRRVRPLAHPPLVVGARAPRDRAAEQAGRRLRRLDQEAVAVAECRRTGARAPPAAGPTSSSGARRSRRSPRPSDAGAGTRRRPGRRCPSAAAAPATRSRRRRRRRPGRAPSSVASAGAVRGRGRRVAPTRPRRPAARPSSIRTRCGAGPGEDLGAVAPGRRPGRSSPSTASSPTASPKPMYAADSGVYVAGSVLRVIGRKS